MIAIALLVIVGLIVIGFGVWVVAFGGMKRRGQSSKAELQKDPQKEGRATGLN